MQWKWNLFAREMLVRVELQRRVVQLIIDSGIWFKGKLILAIKQQQLPDWKLPDNFWGLRNLSVPEMRKVYFF